MILTLTLLLTPGCRDDEPAIDEGGCWLDAEEAFLTVFQAGCEAGIACHPESTDRTPEDCASEAVEAMEISKELDCFDGCTVQACLDSFAAYAADCADGYPSYCWDETFYHNSKVCVERDW